MEKSKEHKHKVVYAVLIVVILLLLSRGEQGRYAISVHAGSLGMDSAYILDTKTSQLWRRLNNSTFYLGTNENPMFEEIEKDEQKQ